MDKVEKLRAAADNFRILLKNYRGHDQDASRMLGEFLRKSGHHRSNTWGLELDQ